MKKLDASTLVGYACGIAAGVAYGCNPLFSKGLLSGGASVFSVLFFRYLFAVVLMGLWMIARGERFILERRQYDWMLILGMLFGCSSLFLFLSYNYIPAGLATTIVYIYPVFTAIIALFMGQKQGWKVWLTIFVTLMGVAVMTNPFGDGGFNWWGIASSALSALSYAGFLAAVNNAKRIKDVSAHTITFYSLCVGLVLFLFLGMREEGTLLDGISGIGDWANLLALGVVPTMVAMLTLSISTKKIGATKTAVLGVFEPVTAIFIGTVLFGEAFSWNVAAGSAICIAAVLFMILTVRR